MAYLRHSYGKYTLDLSEAELDAVTNAMSKIDFFTDIEKGIYHQLVKHRRYLKEEEKWYQMQEQELETRQELIDKARFST
jgi:hypothetical protein